MSLQNVAKSFSIDFISGGMAGLIGKLIICPIDKVKILLQTQNYMEDINTKKINNSNKYKELFHYLNSDIKKNGMSSLWVGNMTNISRYMTNQAFNFGIKGQIKKHIKNKLLCGGVTGIVSSIILFPFDLVKVKLVTDKNNKYKGFFDCIQKIKKESGITGMFNGLGVSIVGNFCYRGLYFGLYDLGNAYFFNKYKIINIFLKKYIMAQSISLISETLTYPLDTIRKRRILNNNKDKNIKKCIQNIYTINGFSGFYNGILINSLRTIGSSFVLVSFEIIRNKIKNKERKNDIY